MIRCISYFNYIYIHAHLYCIYNTQKCAVGKMKRPTICFVLKLWSFTCISYFKYIYIYTHTYILYILYKYTEMRCRKNEVPNTMFCLEITVVHVHSYIVKTQQTIFIVSVKEVTPCLPD
jgi:hypothetical protein